MGQSTGSNDLTNELQTTKDKTPAVDGGNIYYNYYVNGPFQLHVTS